MPTLNAPLLWLCALLLGTTIVAGIGWKYESTVSASERAKVAECRAKHEAFVAKIKVDGEIAQAKAKAEEERNAKIADETAKGWAAAIAVVRADRDSRLRIANKYSSGSGLSQTAQDRPGVTQADADPIPAPERVATDCAETTVTANFLQTYIERIQGDRP